jgi:hypothetical protein
MTPHVFIALPTYNGQICIGLAKALLAPFETKTRASFAFHSSSLLAKSFNHLWCDALNNRDKGITHFLMVHADIAPEEYFAEKMLNIMAQEKADVLSVISPLKSADGLTSTGLDLGDSVRRFTMKEIHAMPHATFHAENLMVNTGLMLVDITKPWVETIEFQMWDRIVEKDGKRVAVTVPEDWMFSRHARENGAKLYATREIKLEHMGSANYPNHAAWGRLSVDEGCQI